MDALDARTRSGSNAIRHRELIGAWLASYASVNTRASYQQDVLLFCTFLDEVGLDLLAVNRYHIDVFARTRTVSTLR